MKNNLANSLKDLIAKNKISARTLAKETGLSISTISDVLNGRSPSLKNLQILSDYFGVTLDFLVNGKRDNKIIQFEQDDFEDMFEGVVKIKISKLKSKGK